MTPPSAPLYPVTDGMKICSRKDCKHGGMSQTLDRFETDRKAKSGLTAHCKSCANAYKRAWGKAWAKSHPDDARLKAARNRASQSHKAWYQKNKEILHQKERVWRTNNPAHVKAEYVRRRFRAYGVTPAWYDQTLEAQGGKCAICGTTDPKSNGNTFHVDHNHGCHKESCKACDRCRRGLLCGFCNTRLGHLENPDWIAKAMAYLSRFSMSPE